MGSRTGVACGIAALLSACGRSVSIPPAPRPAASVAVMRTIGLPVYPGSAPTEGGSAVASRRGHSVIAAYYRTPDSLERVEKYYAARLPKKSLKMYLHLNGQGLADFSVTRAGVTKQVTLSQSEADTIIALSAVRGR
ncbi:MAG: hypothetical protein GIW99_08440 [Candidatus Eremiobacteraeota bacterium]|nr:hypothetical protein [Candidatus Eremiobacteraeota bacterium]MBC5827692.1 hypothetical protein [Candidatus Eremiobacteraeota bacterium]